MRLMDPHNPRRIICTFWQKEVCGGILERFCTTIRLCKSQTNIAGRLDCRGDCYKDSIANRGFKVKREKNSYSTMQDMYDICRKQ